MGNSQSTSTHVNLTDDGKLYFSYSDIHETIINVLEGVKKFNPDVIVAIGTGGFIPARILRTHLKVPIIPITLNLYNDKTKTARKQVEKVQWIDSDRIQGKRVLVVDDVDDSRKTLEFCVQELKSMNKPKAVAIAVIHNKLKKKVGKIPEGVTVFVGKNIPDKWINYPWDAPAGNSYYKHQQTAQICTRKNNSVLFFLGMATGLVAGVLTPEVKRYLQKFIKKA